MRAAASIMVDLASSGLSANQIALVMELSAALAAEAQPKRSKAAERQARYAARQKASEMTQNDVSDGNDASVSLDKEAPQTPKEIKPIPCVRETRARDGYHRLPEGWTPTRPLPPKTQAKVDQWPPGALESELAALHRWAANAKPEKGKGLKLNWDTAWVNWIERRDDERYGRHGNGSLGQRMGGPRSDPLLELHRAANAAISRDSEHRVGAGS